MLSTLLDAFIAYTVIAFSGYVLLIPTMIYRRDTFTAIARLMSDYNYGGYIPVVIYNLISIGVAASTMLLVEWNAQFIPALLTAATWVVIMALSHYLWMNHVGEWVMSKLRLNYVVMTSGLCIGLIAFYVLTHIFFLNLLS